MVGKWLGRVVPVVGALLGGAAIARAGGDEAAEPPAKKS